MMTHTTLDKQGWTNRRDTDENTDHREWPEKHEQCKRGDQTIDKVLDDHARTTRITSQSGSMLNHGSVVP